MRSVTSEHVGAVLSTGLTIGAGNPVPKDIPQNPLG